MFVNILSVVTGTESHSRIARIDQEQIEHYIHRCVEQRLITLKQALKRAIQIKDKNEPLIVTLPEFYWNVQWEAIRDKHELSAMTSLTLDTMPQVLQGLMSEFSDTECGEISVIGGTAALLIETNTPGIYDGLNYCLIISNKRRAGETMFPVSMVPKSNVSWIDYGRSIADMDDLFAFHLSDHFNVAVLKQNGIAAEHYTSGRYGLGFDNILFDNCPVSLDICLDYSLLSNAKRARRDLHINNKVDFLLACGMALQSNHHYPDSVQFAVRNDGLGHGCCQFFSVKSGKIYQELPSQKLSDELAMAHLEVL